MNIVGLAVAKRIRLFIKPNGKRCESVTVTSTVFADEKNIVPLVPSIGKAFLEDEA